MTDNYYPVNLHGNYHAHVYFDEQTLASAAILCQKAGELFNVRVGRVHEKLVGPHPFWSCQLAFSSEEFEALIPWLDKQRQTMDVLVHAVTGDDLKDHTDYAYWLGSPMVLNLSIFES